MDETKLTADLPGLQIEVVRRDDSEARAEMMTIRMTAAPSFGAMHAALLQACLNPWAMNPVLAWTRMMQAAWAPWLSLAAPGIRTAGGEQRRARSLLAEPDGPRDRRVLSDR